MSDKTAMSIVKAIEDDLNDRKGLRLDTLDTEIRHAMRHRWVELINPIIQSDLADAEKRIAELDALEAGKAAKILRLEEEAEKRIADNERAEKRIAELLDLEKVASEGWSLARARIAELKEFLDAVLQVDSYISASWGKAAADANAAEKRVAELEAGIKRAIERTENLGNCINETYQNGWEDAIEIIRSETGGKE